MLILTANDIERFYTMKDAIAADKQALKIYSQGNSDVPLRINFDMQKGQCLFMPAHIKGSDIVGIKIVSVFPDNPKLGKPSVPAQVLMLDPQTGEVCAMLDGTFVTQLRTGAVQGAATDLLARKNASRAVLIGTGGQAVSQLEAMLTVRSLTDVAIFDIDTQKAKQFTEEMRHRFAHFSTNLYFSKNLDDDISQADIITSVTTSKVVTFNGEKVKPGTHVNGVGAYTPEMHEIPECIVEKANIRVVDTKEGVFAEAGDIIDPIKQQLVSEDDFLELGDLVIDPAQCRLNDQQITLFKTVGTAVLDVYIGYDIYLKAKEKGIGTFL
ncbi:ornithine cyclodeaminase family protein [Gilliamella sp. Choc4-2]|jgi:ornithine cyclodeaminase|uniref:ornithine cyclodeaminase family protein n=1 Tax=unclassified Gilliamella TaxID=2685620 RepID=UPI00080DE266|nr:ornithine cyclodeaminase family protein [Gilliamella apicola]OCG33026.1 ornithine cyclodeaminase family protein [Gilliamella apicola]OCG43178.1 ornithine cyclodeaminase family protein [Gilliamella apicola]OCG53379.1 ornithine cyclodeaminase family protein [Gilliamella apicola]